MNLLALLSLFTVFGARAAPVCESQPFKSPSGEQRIFKMDFPDGRRITVVGQNHGDRSVPVKILNLPESPDYFKKVRELIGRDPAANKTFREDVQILKTAIGEGAKFAGHETTPDGLEGATKAARDIHVRMGRFAAVNKQNDPQLIADATLSVLGAPLALSVMNDVAVKNLKQVAFEDRALNDGTQPLLDQVNAINAELEHFAGKKPEDKKLAADLIHDFRYEIYGFYDPDDKDFAAKLTKMVKGNVPERFREIAGRMVTVHLPYYAKIHRRDVNTARQLLLRKQSGIHFIGAAHVNKLMNLLSEACKSGKIPEAPKAGPSAPTGAAPSAIR